MPSDNLESLESLQHIAFEDNDNRNPDGTFASKGTGDQTGGNVGTADIRARQAEKVKHIVDKKLRISKKRLKRLTDAEKWAMDNIEPTGIDADDIRQITWEKVEKLAELLELNPKWEWSPVNDNMTLDKLKNLDNSDDSKALLWQEAQHLSRRISKQRRSAERRVSINQSSKKNLKGTLDKMEQAGVFDFPASPNAQEKGYKGTKNAISKEQWKKILKQSGMGFEGSGKNRLMIHNLNKSEIEADPDSDLSGRRPQEKQYDDIMKGKTIIIDSVMKDAPDEIKQKHGQLLELWDSLSDFDREGVDVLRIQYTGYSDSDKRTQGHFRKRVTHQGELSMLNEITVLLDPDDSVAEDASTLMHELAHNKMHRLQKDIPVYIAEFQDKVIEMGADGALTPYVGSYWQSMKKELDDLEKRPPKKGVQDPKTLKIKQVVDLERKEKWRERILERGHEQIMNETHSEYMGFVNAPYGSNYHRANWETLANLKEPIQKIWDGAGKFSTYKKPEETKP